MTAHFVYRCYDADHVLLYIGCTLNVKKRIAAHRRGDNAKASRWLAACMDTYDVTGPYANEADGKFAEADAIRTEQPLFNYQARATEHQAAWMTRRAVASYLIERGHQGLADETLCGCWPEYQAIGELDPHCDAHGHLALPGAEARAYLEPA